MSHVSHNKRTLIARNKLDIINMVKNKRDLKSPRKPFTITRNRSISRSQSATATINENMRVVVRVRPLSNSSQNILKHLDDQTIIFDPKEEEDLFFYHGQPQRNRDIMKRVQKNLNFNFDRVFNCESNNHDLFVETSKNLIKTLMKGYNCSVFVYGATGAGKTHTMIGKNDDPGLTFLTMNELFAEKETLLSERSFEIGLSYLEVYNETLKDLLNPGAVLHLREGGKYGVIVAGLQLRKIETCEKLFELLNEGNRNRTQHPTDSNAESSRSHAVVQVFLRMKILSTSEVRVAKLSMIDLAGSERGSATGCSGARFAEGSNINKSLLALGNCINSLANGQKHVPYRDSKLTRLLKDSLGGNCQTVMIANVSPSFSNYEDTYNTLKYAIRAMKIKSNLTKNVANPDGNFSQHVKLIDELHREVEELKLQLSLAQNGNCNSKETEANRELEMELQNVYEEKKKLEQRIIELESTQNLVSKRKQLKEESDLRLSDICSELMDKKKGHQRLGNAVDRLERQIGNIQKEIAVLRDRNEQFEVRLKGLLEKAPSLQKIADVCDNEISCIKATNNVKYLQNVCNLQEGEIRMRDQTIERLCQVLKPCFKQLKGHGHATDTLTAHYQELIRHFQGIRYVSWSDEIAVGQNDLDEDKHNEKEGPTTPAELGQTFLLSDDKVIANEKFTSKVPTVALSSNHVTTKVVRVAPYRLKENLTPSPSGCSNLRFGQTSQVPAGNRTKQNRFRVPTPPILRSKFKSQSARSQTTFAGKR